MGPTNRAVVVGGGIAVILSALLLKKRFRHVDLIERDAECGGLLRSWTDPKTGASFDLGSHFVPKTGEEEIDQIMLKPVKDDWYRIRPIKSGTYFRGVNEQSPCPDIRIFPQITYERAVCELLTSEIKQDPANLRESLLGIFGKTITEEFYAPVMRKFMASPLEELHPNAYKLFTSNRVLALTASATEELKSIPRYDDRLAFHSFYEGFGPLETYYPPKGGVGMWVVGLVKMLRDQGIRILTNETVNEIIHQDRRVDSVRLGRSKELVPCDFLVWSGNLAACQEAAKLPFEGERPRLQKSIMYHFVIDQRFLSNLYFVTCFDPDLISFRMTFYPNIGHENGGPPPYSCTVEVISPLEADSQKWEKQVFNELIKMGLVSPSSKILFRQTEECAAGFPVMTNSFVKSSEELINLIDENFPNLALVGKALGRNFFMHLVLKETFDIIGIKSRHPTVHA
jgi:hypothetical protein